MKKLFIQDLDGNNIEVVDLDKAIEQADLFRHFKSEDAFCAKRKIHWEHIYSELLKLK